MAEDLKKGINFTYFIDNSRALTYTFVLISSSKVFVVYLLSPSSFPHVSVTATVMGPKDSLTS